MTAAPRSPSARRGAVASAGLGLAMGLSNALGLAFVLILSRPLGPADFGGYSALSTYGVVLAIPAGAMQVLVARHVSLPGQQTSGLRLALWVGTGLAAVTVAAALPLARLLSLSSAWSVVWLALTLVPMTLTGCYQGVLLGTGRLRRLSGLYLVTAVTRLAAAVVAARAEAAVATVFALLLLAAVLTAVWGAWACRDSLPSLPGTTPGLVRELVHSNATLAAFTALTNLDVVFARMLLSPHDSGGYALTSSFGRAIGWGTQFVALLVVPRMTAARPRRTLFTAAGVVVAIGGLAGVVAAADPRRWIILAGGPDFADFAALVLPWVAVGTGWALVQLWLFSDMGSGRLALGRLTWAVVIAQSLVIVWWAHGSALQILLVCACGAATLAAAGLIQAVRRVHAPHDV